MKISVQYLITIFLFLGLTASLTCPIGTFESNQKCEACSANCNFCDSKSNCLYCSFKHFLLDGICFEDCVFPRYPIITGDKMIECRPIETKKFKYNEIIIEDYDSAQGIKSMYLVGNRFIMKMTMTFWIRFEEFGEFIEDKNFLVISPFLVPYETIHNFPQECKLGLHDEFLVGPTEFNRDVTRIFLRRWYLVTIVIDQEDVLKIFAGILIYDFMNGDNIVSSNSKIYFSSSRNKKGLVLHSGNLNKAKNFHFKLKKFKFLEAKLFRFSGTALFQANLTYFYNYQYNFSNYMTPNNQNNNQVSYLIDFSEDFNTYLIRSQFKIITSVLNSSFFRIVQNNKVIYELEMVLVDDSIHLRNGEFYEYLDWEIFEVRILLAKIEDNIVLYDTKNHLVFPASSELKIEVESSLYSTLLGEFYLMITENPSMIDIFEKLNIWAKPAILCNIFKGSNFRNCLLNAQKNCENNSSLHFIYSLSDCNLEARYACRILTPYCDICFNNSYCLRCKAGTAEYKGTCIKNPSLSVNCYQAVNWNSYRCEDCQNLQDNVMHNGACSPCALLFSLCIMEKNYQNCIERIFDLNCTARDAIFCPQNCSACKKENNELKCLACQDMFSDILYKGRCYPKCQRGYIYKNGKCEFACNNSNERIVDGNCVDCVEIHGTFHRIQCLNLCPGYSVYVNNTCVPLKNFKTCLSKAKKWCEFCDPETSNFECRFSLLSYQNDELEYKSIESAKFFTGKFFDEVIECPSSYQINPDLLDSCSRVEKEKAQDLEGENLSTSLKFQIERLCLDYVEGFYTIFINETCIYVPNTHHITLSRLELFRSPIKTQKNARLKIIQLTNNASLFGEIYSDKLYLEKCPNRFYNESNYCLYCGHECLICSGPSISQCQINSTMNEKDFELVREQNHFIFSVNSYGFEFKIISQYSKKCPNACKSCYYTGSRIVCVQCINDDLRVDSIDGLCKCNKNQFFDHLSLSCVERCPNESKIDDFECLSSCLQASSTSRIQKMYDYKDKCYTLCPDFTYAILKFEFEDLGLCLENKFSTEFMTFFDEKKKLSAENLTRTLWNYGLTQLIPIRVIKKNYFFEENFKKISDEAPENFEKIIQTFTVLFLKDSMSIKKLNLWNLIDKIAFQTSSLNTIWKIHYLFQIANSKNLENSSTNSLLHQYVNMKIQTRIPIEEGIDLEFDLKNSSGIIKYVKSRKEKSTYISLYTKLDNSRIDQKINFSLLSNKALNEEVYLANFTSSYMENFEANKTIEIYQRCIYLLIITKKFINESFHMMIDNDIFYGSEIVETEENNSVPEKNELITSITIFFLLVGALLFIYILIVFLKTKILNPSKIKFVQMTDIDSDEEDNIDDDSKEDKFHIRYS